MIGDVSTRSVYLGVIEKASDRCEVLGISPLLGRLLTEAVDLPVAYEVDERANHIMQLIILELRSSVELPLNVPIPTHPKLKSKCRRFLAKPDTDAAIDEWALDLHMSRRAFTRLFRQETGMSLSEWRQQAIVVISLSRLASGESVTAVALDFGYAYAGAFSSMSPPCHRHGAHQLLLVKPDVCPPLGRFLHAGDDEPHRLLNWPASKKRQGTKSRSNGGRSAFR